MSKVEVKENALVLTPSNSTIDASVSNSCVEYLKQKNKAEKKK